MKGFGIRSGIWTKRRPPDAAEHAVARALAHGFVEVAFLDPPMVDAAQSRRVCDKAGIRAVCSLGLLQACRPPRDPEAGITFLKVALDKAAATGADALSGVTCGGIGER